jgi:non-specific serine/threonine protein kinase/NIMA (never in mitosis gene a)-related kinase
MIRGEELRKVMIDLLGEENVGYWHLIDQLLYVEELFK